MTCPYVPCEKDLPSKEHISIAKKVIKYFGSQAETSRMLGWSAPYIHSWLNGKYYLPIDRAEHIEKVTRSKFTVIQLRPDLKKLKKYFV